MLIMAVWWGLRRSAVRLVAGPFVLTALYCLLSPVFADYHLLIFLAPLLLLFFHHKEWTGQYRLVAVIALASVLILSPKNYVWLYGISWQAIVNPVILYFATLYVANEAAGASGGNGKCEATVAGLLIEATAKSATADNSQPGTDN
jgi:hypothetical protein